MQEKENTLMHYVFIYLLFISSRHGVFEEVEEDGWDYRKVHVRR